MKKQSWASELIARIKKNLSLFKGEIEKEIVDTERCYEIRAEINGDIIQAIFGGEILEKNSELYMKFNKKPADQAELAIISRLLSDLCNFEELLTPVGNDEEDDDLEIPSASDISDAIEMLQPKNCGKKKELVDYLLNSEEAVGRMQIGPVDVSVLAALSQQYRTKRRNKIILFSAIGAAAVAAGVGTFIVVKNIKHNSSNNYNDNPEDQVEIDEDDTIEIDDTDIISTEEEVPHVDIE